MEGKKESDKPKKTKDLRRKDGTNKLSTAEVLANFKPKKRRKSAKPLDKPEVNQNDCKSISVIDNHISDLDMIDIEIKDNLLDLKGKMTNKELKFLELYVKGFTIGKAMKLAGYLKGTNTYRYLVAKKIIEKYERSAEDHKNIFRMVGLGELAVARGILRCCQTAKTDKDKREAYALAAKCLGLQREVIEGVQGVTIIIAAKPGQPAANGARPAPVDITPAPAPRPLMITK